MRWVRAVRNHHLAMLQHLHAGNGEATAES
jgi:hypothetical protein